MNIVDFIARLKDQGINIRVEDNNLKITAGKGKLSPGLVQEIKENKSEILDFLKELSQNQEEFEVIEPAEKREYYPLSSTQKRMYIISRDEKSTTYNIPTALEITGNLEHSQVEDIFFQLIQRHESFRTSFHSIGGEPVQRIHESSAVDFKIEEYQIGSGTIHNIIKNFIAPFELSQVPLVRFGILTVGENKKILMIDMHHIISDGTSVGIINREFMKLYTGAGLPPVAVQYKDYAVWQNTEKEKKRLRAMENYWLEQFASGIPSCELPMDYQRPGKRDYSGDNLVFEIDKEQTAKINKLAYTHECTLFMVLLAIFNILISKLNNQEEIIVGTPVAGRSHAAIHGTVGMFVNTLVMKNLTPGETTFEEYLERVKKQVITAFENQDYPFEYLVEKLATKHGHSSIFRGNRNPIFDVMFILQNVDNSSLVIPGLQVSPLPLALGIAKFDLNFSCIEKNKILVLDLEYSTELFVVETIKRFASYYLEIISAVTADPGILLQNITISFQLSSSESSLAEEAEGDFGF